MQSDKLLAMREELITKHKTERNDDKRAALEDKMRDLRDTLKARNVEFADYQPYNNPGEP
jgi:hypothetical protein